MSFVECNPNHCGSVIAMGESLVAQEIKIKELEQQKAELIDLLKRVCIANGIDPTKVDFLKKYSGE